MKPETVNFLAGTVLVAGLTLMGICLILLYWKDIFKKKPPISEELIYGIFIASAFFITVYTGISITLEKKIINIIGAFILSVSMTLASGITIFEAGRRVGKKEAEKKE